MVMLPKIEGKSMDDVGKMLFEILTVVIMRNYAPEEGKALFATLYWMVDEIGDSQNSDDVDVERVKKHYITELGREIDKRRVYKPS